MRVLKIAIMIFAVIMAGLNAIGWVYLPNYWIFGLAFMGFSIVAALVYIWLVIGSTQDPRGVPVQVYNCARCTQDHQMYFVTFAYHSVVSQGDVEFTHWGMCPVLNEPVLMRIVDIDTKHAENY